MMKRLLRIFLWVLITIVVLVIGLTLAGRIWNNVYNDPEAFIVRSESKLEGAEIRTIQANGLRFAYREAGEGPLVLLIHGFPDSLYTYDHILPLLADAGYHAVAYAQRGYAPSDIPADGDYSFLTLGQDVLALIEAFGEESAIVVGHDFGAIAAYAAANLDPQRVDRLVTIAIPHQRITEFNAETIRRAPHFLFFQFGFLSEWLARRNNFAYLDGLIDYWSPSWDQPLDQMGQVKEDFSEPGRLRAALGYYQAVLRNSDQLSTMQRRTEVPTLTFAGEEDGPSDLATFDRSAEAYTGYFKLVVVNGVGHFVHQEAADEFVTQLLEFLALTPEELK